ncbi:MAG TPA: MFS transporter [Candidatus Limnocylindrales bacterium]
MLRHRDFLKLWSAETISQFGTQISLLAIPLIAVLAPPIGLGATPFEVGLLGAVEFSPFILFSLPAGAWVDRLRRRPILILGDLGRAISLASIPVAYVLNDLTIWQLYVVGFVNGTLTVFFDVAYQSYLPSLVARDQIVEGNSRLEVSRSLAQIGGPGLGGFLIAIVTAPIAVVFDSISFIGSALFVFAIRKAEPTPDRDVDEHGQRRGSMREEVTEGLRYVLGNRYLRSIAACTAWSNLFSNMAFAIFILYLVRLLGLTPPLIGIVFAASNVGALVGAIVATPVARRLGLGRAIFAGASFGALTSLLIPLAPAGLAGLPLLVVGGFGAWLGTIVYNVNQVSLRQAITPHQMQGRMNATMRFIVWGTIPIGELLGGYLGSTIGVRETIWIGFIGGAFAWLPLLIGPLLTLREMPVPAES